MPAANRVSLILTVLLCPLCAALVAAEPTAEAAAKVSVTDSEGKSITLSTFKKPMVLLFMRGWDGKFACYFCGIQMHQYKAKYDTFKQAGAEVLVILPGAKETNGFVKKTGLNDEKPDPNFEVPFPVVADPDFAACKVFNVLFKSGGKGLPVENPATVIIGTDGDVVKSWHGDDAQDRPTIDDVLKVLKGGAVQKAPEKKENKGTEVKSSVNWTTYDDGMKAAKESKRPIFLEFYATWCGVCRQTDNMTYTQPEAAVITAPFICIRVNIDEHEALAKKFEVDSMPDIRILSAEGREFDKAVGFCSLVKLKALTQKSLDTLAGKTSVRTNATEAVQPKNVNVTHEAIAAATQNGVRFLQVAAKKGWPSSDGMGPDELVLYAWLSSGVDPKSDPVAKLRQAIISTPITKTYQAALRALALEKFGAQQNQAQLGECAKFLLDTQLVNGQWTYGQPEAGVQVPTLGDNSNTAYALLGLAACKMAGINLPIATIQKVETWWRDHQNKDGGWGYRANRDNASYASMTESGVSSILLCGMLMDKNFSTDAVVMRGLEWLGKHWAVPENRLSAYQEGRILYHLYALERTGTFLNAPDIEGHDWYQEGSAYILGTQRADGSWDDGADTSVSNTCFALLYLNRGSRSLREPPR